MVFIGSLLNALIAIPQIAKYVELFAAYVTGWYISNVKSDEKQGILDSIALTLKAETRADRLAALDKWHESLSKKRILQ